MTPPQQPPRLQVQPRVPRASTPASSSLGLGGGPGCIWDLVSDSFTPSSSPGLGTSPAAPTSSSSSTELAWVRRQLDEARRKIRRWEESWQLVEQACDAWQRAAQEAKERALAADSARQLALQKKQEVEAQFRRLQEQLEGRGPRPSLPGLRGGGEVDGIPLPQLHSLQSRLRLDLEAVDGVIFQLHAKQCAVCREHAQGTVLQHCPPGVLSEPCVGDTAVCASRSLPW